MSSACRCGRSTARGRASAHRPGAPNWYSSLEETRRGDPMIENGRPIVLRRGTVLTMNDGHEILHDAYEIDASDGIVMPGMVDTHRHMWQTALRGYGADWTLSQYFVFFYLEWGKIFRPQDIHAGNVLSAIESLDAGVTTTVDWSHGLQTVDHADAAVTRCSPCPGRFVLAYG